MYGSFLQCNILNIAAHFHNLSIYMVIVKRKLSKPPKDHAHACSSWSYCAA